MKIFPIKVEKEVKTDYKFIEWKLHNVCNHDCSFCNVIHKDGTQRWFTLEKYKEYTDKIVEACNGAPFWFQITGGEPTLYPDLIPLLQYMKSKGAMISLISNGSRTIRWWEELQQAKVIDFLFLTYHSEQTDDYQHVTKVANLFHEDPMEVICLITHVHNTVDKAFEAQSYMIENSGAIITLKAMNIGDYDIYSIYTPEQLSKIKSENWLPGKQRLSKVRSTLDPKYRINHNLQITNNDGSTFLIDPQILMKEQKNKFYGWDCNIGSFTMRIDHDVIYRGVCGEGEKRSLYDDEITFIDNYVTCSHQQCYCGTDMIATKILPESMYPQA
jgi:organic radical activating enzyme